jgi:hypothetical protein
LRCIATAVVIAQHQLPYDGGRHWSLPARGGYQGGSVIDEAEALTYVKYLREAKRAGIYHNFDPQQIVFDMISERELGDARRGHIVGFFAEIGRMHYTDGHGPSLIGRLLSGRSSYLMSRICR